MALTAAERQRKSRLRKAAAQFSETYLAGATAATPKRFIEAKRAEFEAAHLVTLAKFDPALTDRFYSELAEHETQKKGVYLVETMLEAWKAAEAATQGT